MFQINAEDMLLIYCVLILALLSGLWLYNELKRAKPKSDLSMERLCRCKNCSHIYLISRYETMSRCPQCDDLNYITDRTKI